MQTFSRSPAVLSCVAAVFLVSCAMEAGDMGASEDSDNEDVGLTVEALTTNDLFASDPGNRDAKASWDGIDMYLFAHAGAPAVSGVHIYNRNTSTLNIKRLTVTVVCTFQDGFQTTQTASVPRGTQVAPGSVANAPDIYCSRPGSPNWQQANVQASLHSETNFL